VRQLLLKFQEGQALGLADVDSSHGGKLAAVGEKQETDGYNGWRPGPDEEGACQKKGI